MASNERTPEDVLARKLFQSLLDGDPPEGVSIERCGRWADAIGALSDAHARGGTEAARQAFNALARADAGLLQLVSGSPVQRKDTWTVAELYDTDFPEPRWAVPSIIPVGLTFLAGRPKVGKSWLALQVAHAVGTGGRLLDQDIERGKVEYLALEDSPRRLKERQSKQGIPRHADITFKIQWEPLGSGGLSSLQAEIEQEGYSLVIVDTLSRALGRADQGDLAEMTAVLGNLQQAAQIYDLAILLIDHHRKPSGFAADPIDDILGTTAKAAVADAVLGLFREGQGKRETSLRATGRDLDEIELALEWDGLTCCWHLLGVAGEVRQQTVNAEVMEAISALVKLGQVPSTTRIARHLEKKPGHVSRALGELFNLGKVVKGDKVGREIPYYTHDLVPS